MFSLQRTIVVLVFLGSFVGISQNKWSKEIDSIQEMPKATDQTAAFARFLRQIDTTSNSESNGILFYEIARSHEKAKSYQTSLYYLAKAIQLKKLYKDTFGIHKSQYVKALVYSKLKKPEQEKEALISIVNDEKGNIYTCNAYRKLARSARKNGDFFKALRYLHQGLANEKLTKTAEFESKLSLELILCYAAMYQDATLTERNAEDLKSVEKYSIIIAENSSAYPLSPKLSTTLHNCLAILYDTFEKFEHAIRHYEIAKSYAVANGDKEDELSLLHNIGILHSKLKEHSQAVSSYKEVITNTNDIALKAAAYNSLGYYHKSVFAKEKLPFLEKAITIIVGRKNDAHEKFQLPNLEAIKASGYAQDVLIYLIDLAAQYVQVYKEESMPEYLQKAKRAVQIIDQLVSLIRYETDTEDSKLFWIEKGVNSYVLAVEISYLLQDVESGFYFMEKNKALLLQEHMKTLQTKLKSDVPSDLIAREHELHYQMLTQQEKFQEHMDDQQAKTAFATTYKTYRIFMDSLQKMYPEYAKTKQEVSIRDLKSTLQEFQSEETAFVEYILHDTDGYGIYFDTGKPIFFKIPNVLQLHQNLQKVKSLMTRRSWKNEEAEAYEKVAHDVLSSLFAFQDFEKHLQNKRLTVIPDQALQYVPLEVLTLRKEGSLVENYLVNHVEISYLQSFSLFDQIREKENHPTKKLLTIAPQKFTDTTLPTLLGDELLQFLSIYDNSELLKNDDASKENFREKQHRFEIIHLNTHAGLDEVTQMPWIAFYEEKMKLAELFGMENQADLVILDACQTNNGINISGEGVMNLSRGFFYNGTQSVIASQWNVNAQTSNEILQTFYTELQRGTSKSEALQIAKKAYLKQHQFSLNTPYYWAAFTLTGSTNSVQLQTTSYAVYGILGAILILLVAGWFLFRKVGVSR